MVFAAEWRKRLIYGAMSLFVAWHTLAMVVAPSPDSELKRLLLRVLHPYVTLLKLQNTWDFYAPNVGYGQQFRYIVEDAKGGERTFVPTRAWGWSDPHYWWYTAWYNVIIDAPEDHAALAMALRCKEHAKLDPATITLIRILQKDFRVQDQLNRKNPMDTEFVTVSVLKRGACPGK
jgi:hypothetical protein